jgi:hypothetical protein
MAAPASSASMASSLKGVLVGISLAVGRAVVSVN